MSALIDYVMGALNPPQPTQIDDDDIQLQRVLVDLTANSPEPPQRRRNSSRAQPPPAREVIDLVDSDDDEPMILGMSFANTSRGPRTTTFSPPPPPLDTSFPPVPSVPSRYAGHTSFAARHRTPGNASASSSSAHAGVIRPSSQPLAFEFHTVDSARQTPVAGPSRVASPPRAAPPSHHTPSMGFGGALLSTHAPARRNPGPRPRHAATQNLPQANRFSFLSRTYNGVIPHFGDAEDGFIAMLAPWWGGGAGNSPIIHNLSQGVPEPEVYKPEYTHPFKPEADFTFHFIPPDDKDGPHVFPPTSRENPIIIDDDEPLQSSSSSAAAPPSSDPPTLKFTLQCAKCEHPLLLNAGLSPEQLKERRVWALRCGHLIDECCLKEIGRPPEPVVEASVSSSKDRKGKGKAQPQQLLAYATVLPDATSTEPSEPEAIPVPAQSTRRRLRSHAQASSSTTHLASTPTPASPEQLRAGPPAKKRRVAAKKSKIQERYEWDCPVEGCGRKHMSAMIDGVWGPEREYMEGRTKKEGRGAIPIFT